MPPPHAVSGLRTLFLGGTGIISSACVSEALSAGHDVTVLNRRITTHRPLPDGVRVITADVRHAGSLDAALGAETFDVVVDFLSFEPGHVQTHIERWAGNAASTSSSVRPRHIRRPPIDSQWWN